MEGLPAPGVMNQDSVDGEDGAKGAGEVASIGGKTCVNSCFVEGVTRYVGITDDIVKRGQAHLREKASRLTEISRERLQRMMLVVSQNRQEA